MSKKITYKNYTLVLKDGTEVNSYRANGECVCIKCGKLFNQHPLDDQFLTNEGDKFLNVLCNGDRVKL